MSDDSRTRFSIVIPTHNYGHFLPTTLDSVLGQKTERDEVIVVDDASTDKTSDVVRQYGAEVTYVRLDENVGPGGAWAVGLSRSSGEYVCKLDADDWHLKDSLARFAAAFKTDPSVGMVAGAVYALHEDSGITQKIQVQGPRGFIGAEEFRKLLLGGFFFHMPGVSVRRAALQGALPRTDLWMPHDWEYLIRTLHGWSCFVVDDPVAVYRIHDTSVTRTADQATRLHNDLMRLSNLALDAGSGLQMSESECRVFHRALGETYLRLAPLLGMRPSQFVARVSFASRLVGLAPRNGASSKIAFAGRVLGAKIRSFVMWRLQRDTANLTELAPKPYPSRALDD
jgi:glycosyltransferase involved in cell wall biosynthesis